MTPSQKFVQEAFTFFFGDGGWICVNRKLYQWQGDRYEYIPDCVHRPKIASYCNLYRVVKTKKNGLRKISYPYAKPAKVIEILRWSKNRLKVDPSLLELRSLDTTH